MTTEPIRRHLFRTFLIRAGIFLAVISLSYLIAGLADIVPMTLEKIEWNNIRIISGLSILGCMMAALGYGDE
jgi:hypothetical protein